MSEIWAGDWLVPYFVRRERPSGGDLGWCLHGGGGSREGKAEEGKAKVVHGMHACIHTSV